MKTPTLKTDRLLLRPVTKQNTENIFTCWMNDSEVSKYMWWKASDDIQDAIDFVDFELSKTDSDDWYRWILEKRENREIIGTCLVYYNDDENHWDISYNLGRKFWGKGYATESMKKALDFAENELMIDKFYTSYAVVNTASANVLHKLGFTDIKNIPYECNGGDIVTDGMLCEYITERIKD